MNAIVAQLKKHTSITLLALAILALTPLQAMEQPKNFKVPFKVPKDLSEADDGDWERVQEVQELIDAAKNGDLKRVQELIDNDVDVDEIAEWGGDTALMIAAANGHLDVVKTLINAQADIDDQDNNGVTALMKAAKKGHLEIVKALLTEVSIEHAKKIKNNFTGLLALNRMQFMPKDVRRLITQKLIQELVDERMQRANEIMRITNEDDLTAQDFALAKNHKELAALLDPNNAESQKKLRAIIENKIRRILFGDPKKKEKKVELDDPFGTWNEE